MPNHNRIQEAVDALTPFGRIDAETAVLLLSAWKHRHTLTTADVAVIKARYAKRRR